MTIPSTQPVKREWLNLLLLRPYGAETLTPKVTSWIGSSLIVIMFMSALEGLVWGMISRYLVPDTDITLKWTINSIVTISIFCIIWIADTSLIVFEPKKNPTQTALSFFKSPLAWFLNHSAFVLGIFFRIGIIGISLYITAPMLTQVIRDADISGQIEKERSSLKENFIKRKEAELKKEKESLDDQANLLKTGTTNYSTEQASYQANLKSLDERIIQYRDDLRKYDEAVQDNLNGNKSKGIKKGKGIEYSKAVENQKNARKALDKATKDRDDLKPLTSDTTDSDNKLKEIADKISTAQTAFNTLRDEINRMDVDTFVETYNDELTDKPPKMTPGYRVYILEKITEEEKNNGHSIDHFKSTEGIAQALLSVLFLSLLALKCFEPDEVSRYFNEDLQDAWRRYTEDKLDDLPGFRRFKKQIDGYASFVECYVQYQLEAPKYIAEEEKKDDQQRELERKKTENAFEVEKQRIQLEIKNRELEISREEQRIQLEIENRKLEISLEGERLDKEFKLREQSLKAEQDQAKQELDLREQRIQNELVLEKVKIQEIADNLKHERELKESEHALIVERLETELKTAKQRADLEIKEHQDQYEAKKKILQFELDQAEANTQNEKERLKQELAFQLTNLEDKFKAEKDALTEEKLRKLKHDQNEFELATKRLQNQIDQEQALFQQEMDKHKAELARAERQLDDDITIRNKSLEVELEQNKQELAQREKRMKLELTNELEKINTVKELHQNKMRLNEYFARIGLIRKEITRIEQDKNKLLLDINAIERQLGIKNTFAKDLCDEIEKSNPDPQGLSQKIQESKMKLDKAQLHHTQLMGDDLASEESIEYARKAVDKRKNELHEAKNQLEQSGSLKSEPQKKLTKTQKEIADLSHQQIINKGKLQALDVELEKLRQLHRELVLMDNKHG